MDPEDEFYPFDVADDFYRRLPDFGWEEVDHRQSQSETEEGR